MTTSTTFPAFTGITNQFDPESRRGVRDKRNRRLHQHPTTTPTRESFNARTA